jgi:putative transposase
MANTFTQIYIHIIFAILGRHSLIRKEQKVQIYKYITGIIQNKGNKLIAINGMPDHIHIFIGLNPSIKLSDLVKVIKTSSSDFIKSKNWYGGKFQWQEGYGAFSYSRSQIPNVARYIENQEQHHKKRTFKEEYIEMLRKFEIEFNEKYLFEWIDY